MTLNDIKIQLRAMVWARERRMRHPFIMNLLEKKYGDLDFRDRKRVKDFIDEYNTCVRYVQMAQKEDEGLQGEDYSQGEILKEKKVIDLGYEVGYNQDTKNFQMFV